MGKVATRRIERPVGIVEQPAYLPVSKPAPKGADHEAKQRRETADRSTSADTVAGCKIMGNISDGQKNYRLPGSRTYKRTAITSATGERWFCSEREAKAAGWRPARD